MRHLYKNYAQRNVSISPIIDLLLDQINKTGTSEDDLDNSVQDLDQSVM